METLTNKRVEHGRHKETLTNKRRRRADLPLAAAGPGRWLLLHSRIDDERSASSIADAKTTVASCTSSGEPFSISFGIAAPPACCSVHFAWLGGGTPCDSDGKHRKSKPFCVDVIAGHDNALLIELRVPHRGATTFDDDYFVYEAGCGARPPALSLLPGFYVPVQNGLWNHRDRTPRFRNLGMENTGILRRGEADLLVCQFERTCDPHIYYYYNTAELCMLRVGRDREWIVKLVPIVEHREGSSKLQPLRWSWEKNHTVQAATPVGNRFLCWVHYSTGFILCNMVDEETPKVRYVPLPATRHDGYCGHYPCELQAYYTLGAAGPDAVRFVSVNPPRCCRYVQGKTSCEGSSSSFSVRTWTMTLSTEEPTKWVKDVVLDCDEIWKWRLPSGGCLPRDKHLEYPMVSSDDPDVIYFKVEGMAVAINTRSEKLLSVIPSGGMKDHMALRQRSIMAKLCW